jgi:hypothetical protein
MEENLDLALLAIARTVAMWESLELVDVREIVEFVELSRPYWRDERVIGIVGAFVGCEKGREAVKGSEFPGWIERELIELPVTSPARLRGMQVLARLR